MKANFQVIFYFNNQEKTIIENRHCTVESQANLLNKTSVCISRWIIVRVSGPSFHFHLLPALFLTTSFLSYVFSHVLILRWQLILLL